MQYDKDLNEIVHGLGILFEMSGKSSVTGKIIGILHFKGPKTQDELKEEVGCSLSAISQSMKHLKSIGLLSTEKGEGRKKRYCIEFSKEKIDEAVERVISFGLNPLLNILDEKEKSIHDQKMKQKVKNMKKMYLGVKEKMLKTHTID